MDTKTFTIAVDSETYKLLLERKTKKRITGEHANFSSIIKEVFSS